MPQVVSGTEPAALVGRFGVIVSRYNESITRRLLQGAVDTLLAAGIPDQSIDVCWTPGAWELPLIAQELAFSHQYAAIICLGAVIRGETTHDEHINRQVSLSLGQIALDAALPVAFGVLTCNTLEQALQRAGGNVGNKGQEAAEAALEMARLLVRLRQPRPEGPASNERPPVAPTFASRDREPEPDEPVNPKRPGESPLGSRRPLFPTPPEPPAGDVPPERGAVEMTPAEITAKSAGSGSSASSRRGPRVRRRRAREVVLQMLYADDVNPSRNMAEADEFLKRRLRFDAALVEFASGLLAGVRRNRAELDQILTRQAANWSLPRMAVTDRNVLRLGAYEILFTETPRVVVINEAVELARRYGSRQSAQFVNGILDRLNAERRNAPME